MYTMKQVCEMLSISYETLRFYCNEGLIPNVKRDRNRYRRFDDRDVNWLKSLLCLKRCSMSVKDIRAYMDLCRQGASSIQARQAILAAQRQKLVGQMEQLRGNIDFIDEKQRYFAGVLSGEIPYTSNLIDIE